MRRRGAVVRSSFIMAHRLQTVLFFIFACCLPLTSCHNDTTPTNGTLHMEHQARLTRYLKLKANPLVRPVGDTGGVKIRFGLALVSLDEVNERERTMTTTVWSRHLWWDPSLMWNPDDYGGITTVRFPIDHIWTADLTVYNSKDHMLHTFDALAVIYSSGDVLWIPPGRVTSMCKLDMTYFPFDVQECTIKIGSWTYDGIQVALSFYEGMNEWDLSDYENNIEWDVIGHGAKYNEKYYPCCSEPYPDITFTLRIRRKALYYSYVYLGPAVLLALLAPFVFLLPPGNSQKMTLGCSILICFTLLIGDMGDLLPSVHNQIPLIDMYFMSQYVLLSLSIAMTCIVANLAKRTATAERPPHFLKKVLVSGLGRCLCVSDNSYVPAPFSTNTEGEDTEGDNVRTQHKQEWMLMATVIDRLFFVFYLILTIMVTLCILLRRP